MLLVACFSFLEISTTLIGGLFLGEDDDDNCEGFGADFFTDDDAFEDTLVADDETVTGDDLLVLGLDDVLTDPLTLLAWVVVEGLETVLVDLEEEESRVKTDEDHFVTPEDLVLVSLGVAFVSLDGVRTGMVVICINCYLTKMNLL